MPIYKDKNHKGSTPWFAKFQYTDSEGNKRTKIKRGFRTEKEAKAFEKKFLADVEANKDYLFEKVVEFYFETCSNQIKLSSLQTKQSIFEKFILPDFSGKDIRNIKTSDLTRWQNKRLFARDKSGERLYSDTYIKTVNSQLRGLFNFAVANDYLERNENPILDLSSVGKKESERDYIVWTRKDFSLFLRSISDYEDAYYAFLLLFYTGIRKGELLALTIKDFDYENQKLYVNKTFSVIKGEEVITTPKTKKSKREVILPDFVCEALHSYIKLFYKPDSNQRIFPYKTGKFLLVAMEAGCNRTGLPKIRIHDLRHSHITYLQNLAISSMDIASRVGHKNVDMTMHYSHSSEETQRAIVEIIERDGDINNVG